MIFRDDDIGYLTKIEDFRKVHEIFNEYGCVHTLAIITKDLWKHKELVKYITEQYEKGTVDCQVHCYTHDDFASLSELQVRYQLKESKKIIEELFGIKPTGFYPPFNSVNLKVIQIASEEGLTTSTKKVSCVYYIQHKGDVMDKVINFHYHDNNESILIEPCLKIYKDL